jgi:hypothetical protein
LRRIIRRQPGGCGRIEHVVDHLGAVEGTRVDHSMQRRVTDCSEPKKPRLALLARRSNAGATSSSTCRTLSASPPPVSITLCRWKMSTRSRRSRARLPSSDSHGVGNVYEVSAWQPDLGANDHVGRFEALQHAAEILFRFAVAVLHRGVEVVHAGGDRPRNGALLVEWITAHHERPRRSRNPVPRAAFRCARILAFLSSFLRLCEPFRITDWHADPAQ